MSIKDKIKFFENQNKSPDKEILVTKPETEFNKLLNFWNSQNNKTNIPDLGELNKINNTGTLEGLHKEVHKEVHQEVISEDGEQTQELIMQKKKKKKKNKINKDSNSNQDKDINNMQQELDNLFS